MIRVTEDFQSIEDPNSEILRLKIIKDKEKVRKHFKNSIALMTSSKATDLVVQSEKELQSIFSYLLRRALNVDATVAEAFNPVTDVITEKQISTLLSVSRDVITHSARVADVLNPIHRFVAKPSKTASGIVSSDAKTARDFYWARNAGVMPKKYFWTTDFVLKEAGKSRRTCFLKLIGEKHGPTLKLLKALSLPDGAYDSVIEHSEKMIATHLPDYAYRKQVLVPLFGDQGSIVNYLAITPMASLSLFDDLSHTVRRFRERHTVNVAEEGKKEKLYLPFHVPIPQKGIKTEYLQFGGSNAQNVSDFAGAVRGFHPCLQARVPWIRSQQDIEDSVRKGRLLLNLSETVNTEAGFLTKTMTHFKQEQAFRRHCKSYLYEATRPLYYYATVIQEAYDALVATCKEERRRFDPSEIDVPMPKTTRELHRLTRVLLEEKKLEAHQVDEFSKILRSHIEKVVLKDKKAAFSEKQGQILKEEIELLLREWTCPVRRIYG